MISNPRIGERVQIWYAAKARPHMPHHGKIGIVRIASRGKPRNHGIEIEGQIIAIPCGNLRKPTNPV